MTTATIPVVDNHCHSLLREPVRERDIFRLLFTETMNPAFAEFVPGMAYYQAALADLAEELGVPCREGEIVSSRLAQDHENWISRLLRGANLDTLLVDDGVPPAAISYSREELARLAGCSVGHVWRLEAAEQELIVAHDHFDDLMIAWRTGLQHLQRRGVVALKSIAAYRTGLDVAPPDEAAAREGFSSMRQIVESGGQMRLAHKPLLEYLLHEALAAASEQGIPIQFHTGYGDPDTDLRLGNPLHLRLVIEEPRYQGAPIVLLHESYPYTRQAAVLTALYPQVYADLSYAVPNIGRLELLDMTRAALGVAPLAKLLYSSDGHSIPEHTWLGARRGRDIIPEVLNEMAARRELPRDSVEVATAAILRDNARHVYRLDDAVLAHPPVSAVCPPLAHPMTLCR